MFTTAIKQMFALHHIKTSQTFMCKSLLNGDTLGSHGNSTPVFRFYTNIFLSFWPYIIPHSPPTLFYVLLFN